MKKFNLYLIFSLFIFLAFPSLSQAIGQITSPIIIADALPSETYEEKITVIGDSKANTVINLSAEGQIEHWTSFYRPDDLTTAVTSVPLKAGEMMELVAKFAIPVTAAKGDYSGVVSVFQGGGKNNFQNESGIIVTQKIDREVKITVNTEERINFNVSIIPDTYDLVQNEPLKIRIIYDNQGNMEISPNIHIKLQSDDKTYYSAIFPYPENTPAVKPRSQYEIQSIEIPTTGFPRGKYIVSLDFYNYDSLSLKKEFYFNLRSQVEKQSLLAAIFNEINKQKPLFLLIVAVILLASTAAVAGGAFNRRRQKYHKYQKPLKVHK